MLRTSQGVPPWRVDHRRQVFDGVPLLPCRWLSLRGGRERGYGGAPLGRVSGAAQRGVQGDRGGGILALVRPHVGARTELADAVRMAFRASREVTLSAQ